MQSLYERVRARGVSSSIYNEDTNRVVKTKTVTLTADKMSQRVMTSLVKCPLRQHDAHVDDKHRFAH